LRSFWLISTSSGLGRRHALDAVHASLVLEVRPDALRRVAGIGLDRHLDVLVAAQIGVVALDHLGLPAARLGEVQVHAQEVGGEQGALRASLASLDLHDDVPAVVGVARDQQSPEALLGLVETLFEGGDLVGERGVLFRELARRLEVVARLLPGRVRRDDPAQLGVAPVDLLGARRIGVDGGITELGLQGVVLGQQHRDRLEHC
jgi:hypothetical protein